MVVVVDRGAAGLRVCQVSQPRLLAATSSRSKSATDARRRLRKRGAATGGGSCSRMPPHSGAGGSWP